MGPREAVESVLRRYATFDGRAGRSEFWWYSLIQVVVVAVPQWLGGAAVVVAVLVGGNLGWGVAALGGYLLVIGSVLAAALFVPFLAVAVRRLHDTGRSGLWLLVLLAPYASVVLYWFWAEDSHPGPNRFGPDPKGRAPVWSAAPAPGLPWYPGRPAGLLHPFMAPRPGR